MDVRLHRAERQVEHLGNLLVGPSFDVAEENAGAVFGQETANSGFDGAAQLFGLDGIERSLLPRANLQSRGLHRFRGLGMRRAVQGEGVQFPAAQVIDGRVVGDLENPGREFELGTIGVDRVKCLDEGLLGQILRQLPVSNHAEKEGEHRPLVAADQFPVRSLLAGTCPEHHLLVAQRSPLRPGAGHAPTRLAKGLPRALHSAPMLASDRQLPVSGGTEKRAYVRDVFTAIAPTYDQLNRIISFHLDRGWRRYAVEYLGWERRPEGIYLDLCAGTLDFSAALATRPGFRGRVVGADFVRRMLELGRHKAPRLRPVNADALDLPFPDAAFDGAMVG